MKLLISFFIILCKIIINLFLRSILPFYNFIIFWGSCSERAVPPVFFPPTEIEASFIGITGIEMESRDNETIG